MSDSETLWTAAHQAPPSTGFSRQEYWSGLPFPSPGDLPNPGSNPGLPHCRQTLYRLSHQGRLLNLRVHQNCVSRLNLMNIKVKPKALEIEKYQKYYSMVSLYYVMQSPTDSSVITQSMIVQWQGQRLRSYV